MEKKINVAILFGGKSWEHAIALQSGMFVARALDPRFYNVHYIGIDKGGEWNFYDPQAPALYVDDPRSIQLGKKGARVDPFSLSHIDVVFPTLHGPLGEDGTVQGLLLLAHIPCVGAGVLGSAIGMDKDVAKRLARFAGVLTSPWLVVRPDSPIEAKELRYPLFVKPASMGSTFGSVKVDRPDALLPSVEQAFCYGDKVLLEERIEGREIQVAVMGNRDAFASLPCEIIPKGDMHTYESKYINTGAAQIFYPARLDPDDTQRVQSLAIEIYHMLECEGFGRIDFFLASNGDLLFNEINTIPGLTPTSTYPKMWQASGVTSRSMVHQLIQLALKRHRERVGPGQPYEALTS